jgi:hypothetical protein
MLKLVGSSSDTTTAATAKTSSTKLSRRVINVAACHQSVWDLDEKNETPAALATRIQAALQDYGVFASVKIYDDEGETACYGGVCARKTKGEGNLI